MSELDELRALVREVIQDVLPKGVPVTETVDLSTDEDLAVFVARLLDADAQTREDLRTGRKRFRLAAPTVPAAPSITERSAATESTVTSEDHGTHVVSGASERTAANGSEGPPAGRTAGAPADAAAGPPIRRIERGAVTERVVRDAARAGERLVLGRGAVLTPLARDRARSSGVEIDKER